MAIFKYSGDLFHIENMVKKTILTDEWKDTLDAVLERLMTPHFSFLYEQSGDEYYKQWGTIAADLLKEYQLENVVEADPEYSVKKEKQDWILDRILAYSTRIFPSEYQDDRTYRFVNQYGQLPKHLPSEWNAFDAEVKRKVIEETRIIDERARSVFEAYLSDRNADH